jgi:hypothetical protein
LAVGLHGDDALWAQHIEHHVGVVRGDHELGQLESLDDSVVSIVEPNHLETQELIVVVVRHAKHHGLGGVMQEVLPLGWDDAKEWSV